MPDPGEPTVTGHLDPANGHRATRRQFAIPTAGGSTVAIAAAARAVDLSTWTCGGCGDVGADPLVEALVGAGTHAAQCGRGAVSSRLAEEITDVRGELLRVDGKASTLLALAGAALTVVLAMLGRTTLPTPAAVAGWSAALLIGAGVALLATAVRPALNGRHGFVRHGAAPDTNAILEQFTTDPADPTRTQRERAEQLRWMAMAVGRKYRRVRLAVDLLLAGVAAAALTAALMAVA